MNLNEVKEAEAKYLLHTYAPYDVVFTEGKGNYLYDQNGKEYLDFLSGIAVCCLGHCHPALSAAIKEQADKLWVCSNYFYNEYRPLLAKKLAESTGLNKVFFANSGAEANECALKLARKYQRDRGNGRYKIYSAVDSFHGRTIATVTATGQPKYNVAYTPLPVGFQYIPYNDERALVAAAADPQCAAILLEPIQGESGVHPAAERYLKLAREVTQKSGVLLIADEVQTGMGRTGKLWAHQHYGIVPDIMTTAKGLAGGYPIGACICTDEVASCFAPGDHGTTFGSAPMACRLALEVLNIVDTPAFLAEVTRKGELLQNALKAIAHPAIKEVRGMGLMVGAELNEAGLNKKVTTALLEKGFVLNACGATVLRFLPPLTITDEEIGRIVTAIKETLEEIEGV